jgi:hypothetical protein
MNISCMSRGESNVYDWKEALARGCARTLYITNISHIILPFEYH